MPKIAVIADDLTGANDTGVQFSEMGFSVISLMDEKSASDIPVDADVWVINTETRQLEGEKAYEQIYSIADTLSLKDIPHVYKKIDSTMRGNVQREIDGLMDRIPFDAAVVIPAYPKNGRITVGGYHLMDGKLIEDSVIAQDPTLPATESYLPELLRKHTKRKLSHLDIRAIRQGERFVTESILALTRDGCSIIVFDCASDRDLDTITEAVWKTGLKVLWVGSAGLAYHVSGKLRETCGIGQRKRTRIDVRPAESSDGRILVVAGSMCEITREQVTFLAGNPDFQVLYANPAALLSETAWRREVAKLAEQVIETVKSGKHPVLTTEQSDSARDELSRWAAETGQDNSHIGHKIADRLALVVQDATNRSNISGLVLTGGDTAYRICKVLNAAGLIIIGEVETGIPMAQMIKKTGSALPVVTKSGAFGKRDSLLRAVHAIH